VDFAQSFQFVDMHVGAADACAQDAYLDIVDAWLGSGRLQATGRGLRALTRASLRITSVVRIADSGRFFAVGTQGTACRALQLLGPIRGPIHIIHTALIFSFFELGPIGWIGWAILGRVVVLRIFLANHCDWSMMPESK